MSIKPSTITLVTGVFDLLHQEHIKFLRAAKALGGQLWVGVESDRRVRELKGEGRPIQAAKVRKESIEQLGLAEQVFILPEVFSKSSDHLKLLKKLQPAVLAVSSHTPHLAAKRKLMTEIGGKVVVVHPYNPDISTTQLISSKPMKESDG